ncbi:hypothetical protein AB0N73_00735 [Microbacterium sp. NPDC089189]
MQDILPSPFVGGRHRIGELLTLNSGGDSEKSRRGAERERDGD